MDTSIASSPQTPKTDPFTIAAPASEVSLATRVRVVCRVRPLTETEALRETRLIEAVDDKTVCLQEKETPNVFTYDSVFDEHATQEDIYASVGQKTLADLFKGFNGTILAYGQTGAGKSHTMMGPGDGNDLDRGIIPRVAENIFTHILQSSDEVEYTVGLSMMEVYKEHIFDLLDPQPKDFLIHEDKLNGIHVRGLSQAFVSSSAEMASVLKQGCKNRRTASTNMNTDSSRSHAILQIILTQKDVTSGEIRRSSLFLVDLAGSEKVDRSGATGITLEETKKINLSLSVLGLVINSLTDPKVNHVPYRDSKLTRILQESLGGNSRTTLIINISPASGSYYETLSTLRFGSRAKKIRNSVHINTEFSVDQLKGRISLLEKRNKYLEEQLEQYQSKGKLTVEDANSLQSTGAVTPLHVRHKSSNSSFNGLRYSMLPMRSNENMVSFQDELKRKDEKISLLEQELLQLKMASLTSQHNEDLKLFKLECALYKLNDKLSDVELINTNLRKHLQISEKIIKTRGVKIDKLRELVSEQQEQVNRESYHFENKLKILKDKFDAQKFHETSKGFAEDSFDMDLTQDSIEHDDIFHRTPEKNTGHRANFVQGSPGSPKMGLNLRIVKPLRGGVKLNDA